MSSTQPSLTILTTRFWPDCHGGVEEHMWHLAGEAARHASVQVITENRLGLPLVESPRENLVVRRAPRLDPGRLWRWPHLPRAWWWAGALDRLQPPGWIWATDPPSATGAILAGAGDRLVYNPPGCWAAMQQVYRHHRHIESMRSGLSFRLMERLAYRSAARVVVASHALAGQFRRFHGSRAGVAVVPRGCDPDRVEAKINPAAARRKLGLPEHGFVAGFVGRLDPCKDIPHLVAAAAMPDTLLSDDRLLLVGDGGDRPRIERAIAACGIADRVILAGDLRGRPLLEAYAAMDVLVLPSLYEGYGMVVLEAMAQGRPVIGRVGNGRSSFTSMAEMIDPGETGLLMHADDPADLAVRLGWCRRHRTEVRQMGRWAQHHLRSRPWDLVVADYLRLIGIPLRAAASWRTGLAA